MDASDSVAEELYDAISEEESVDTKLAKFKFHNDIPEIDEFDVKEVLEVSNDEYQSERIDEELVSSFQDVAMDAELRHAHWNTCRSRMNPNSGWIKDGDKLLLWVPHNYRYNIRLRLQVTIGQKWQRIATPDIDLEKLYTYAGKEWTKIYP